MNLSDVPARYRKLHERALEGRRPLLAIRAHCAMCMGWEDAARGIAECTSTVCPLWPYRFGKRARKPSPSAPEAAPSASAAPRIDANAEDGLGRRGKSRNRAGDGAWPTSRPRAGKRRAPLRRSH